MDRQIEVIPEQLEQMIDVESEPFLLTKTQDKTVTLDMSDGDQVIRPDGDYLMQSVTVEKPDTFVENNIVEDVNIGGVIGSRHIPTIEERTVAVNFHDGDVVVTPKNADAMSQVTVEVPVLPTLENPATTNDILDGKQALDGNGEVITGAFVPPVDTGEGGLYKAWLEQPKTNFSEIITNDFTRFDTFGQSSNTSLVTFVAPNCTKVPEQQFSYCRSLKRVYLPKLVGASGIGRCFNGASAITDLYLPEFVRPSSGWTAYQYSFANCTSLEHLYIPKYFSGLYTVDRGMFDNSSAIKSIVNDECPYGDVSIEAIVILKNGVSEHSSSSWLNPDSPIANGNGYIYVLSALVDSYKAATGYTQHANQIVGINETVNIDTNESFTPMNYDSSIVLFDLYQLWSYNSAALNSITGEVTPITDGMVLLRGWDANNTIKYVAFVKIGKEFDYKAVSLT